MAIRRAKRATNFTIIGNVGLHDSTISMKAKGLLAYMLSLPDDWVFYETELVNHFTDGRDSIRTALKELETKKYLVRTRERDEKGRLKATEWIVNDEPMLDLPMLDYPTLEKPTLDNPTLLSTNQLSTKELSTKSTKDTLSAKSDNVPYNEIIEYLNKQTDSNFKTKTATTRKLIKARFSEGFTLDDFKTVIDKKTNEWKNDAHWNKFLRPQTLFGTKFESYLNQKTKNNNRKGRGYDTSEYEGFF